MTVPFLHNWREKNENIVLAFVYGHSRAFWQNRKMDERQAIHAFNVWNYYKAVVLMFENNSPNGKQG